MFRFTSLFGYRKHSVARRRAVDRRGRFAVEILEGRQLLSAIATHTSVSASPATAEVGQQVEFTATVMANRARKARPTGRSSSRSMAPRSAARCLEQGHSRDQRRRSPRDRIHHGHLHAAQDRFAASTPVASRDDHPRRDHDRGVVFGRCVQRW